MPRLYLMALLIVGSCSLFSQNANYVDSLEAEVDRLANDDSLRLNTLALLWRHYLYRDLARSEDYARQIRREAAVSGNDHLLALGHRLLGINMDQTGDHDSAFYHYRQGIDLYRALDNRLQEGVLLFNTANLHNATGQPDSALAYLALADSAFQTAEYKEVHSAVNHLASSIEREQGRHHRAIELAIRAYELAREIPDSARMADADQQIAFAYLELDDEVSAIRYLERALEVYLAQEDHYYTTLTLTQLAGVHLEAGRVDRAMQLALRAEGLLVAHQLDDLIPEVRLTLAELYIERQEYVLASKELAVVEPLTQDIRAVKFRPDVLVALATVSLARNQLRTARTHAEEYLEVATAQKLTSEVARALGLLATIAKRAGDANGAVDYLERQRTYRDSLYQDELGRQLAQLTLRFERAEQDRRIQEQANRLELLEAQRRTDVAQKIGLALGGMLLLVLLVVMYLAMRQRRIKAEAAKHRMRERIRTNQRELSAHTLEMTRKSRLLGELEAELSHVQGQRPDDRRKIDHVLRNLRSEERIDQDWDNFRTYFQGVHGNYLERLQDTSEAKLSSRELRLASLIRMGLSNTEIAPILGVTADTLYKAKYRLRKKLPEFQAENLDDYLLQL